MTALQKNKKATARRREGAEERQEKYDKLDIGQKIAQLDARPGKARKERAKLAEADRVEDFIIDRDPA